eukprot:781384-Amphidinium_carterae.2
MPPLSHPNLVEGWCSECQHDSAYIMNGPFSEYSLLQHPSEAAPWIFTQTVPTGHAGRTACIACKLGVASFNLGCVRGVRELVGSTLPLDGSCASFGGVQSIAGISELSFVVYIALPESLQSPVICLIGTLFSQLNPLKDAVAIAFALDKMMHAAHV